MKVGIKKADLNLDVQKPKIMSCSPISSVQFSHLVMSDSLWPHELQHTRPPCPSPTPRVHSDSWPSSQWCHPAISSSVVPFSFWPQSLPASESFPMSQLFAWDGQSTWEQIDQDTKETVTDFYFCEFQNHCIVTEAMKLKDTCFLEEKLWPTQTTYATRDIILLAKVHIIKVWFFPVVVHGCEIWTIQKAECQIIDVLELWCWRRILSPLNWKEIKPVSPKGNQHWLLIGRTDAEVAILWPPDAKNQIIRKVK